MVESPCLFMTQGAHGANNFVVSIYQGIKNQVFFPKQT